ncbi:MAG: cytochrome c biogenesis CcdA family protein [Synechococcales cyanobacterium]
MEMQSEQVTEKEPIGIPAVPKQPLASKRWWLYGLLGIGVLVVVFTLGATLSHPLERGISILENHYQRWFDQQQPNHPGVLLVLAFVGGLLASVSPCILALLPVNLSYIGTLTITSRWDALAKAGSFVLGAVTILSLFGLVSSFAGAVLVDFRGHINLVVGLFMVVMGLGLLGVFTLALPPMTVNLPQAGPFGVGLTFALVSSPCASPVLFAVLAAAAATGSQLLGTLTMISYALGYTAIIFLASLWAGVTKQSRRLLHHSERVIQLGSAALIMTGLYYVISGVRWFIGV